MHVKPSQSMRVISRAVDTNGPVSGWQKAARATPCCKSPAKTDLPDKRPRLREVGQDLPEPSSGQFHVSRHRFTATDLRRPISLWGRYRDQGSTSSHSLCSVLTCSWM